MNPLYVGIDVSSRNNVAYLMKPDGSNYSWSAIIKVGQLALERIVIFSAPSLSVAPIQQKPGLCLRHKPGYSAVWDRVSKAKRGLSLSKKVTERRPFSRIGEKNEV